jgi:hypothetical protein
MGVRLVTKERAFFIPEHEPDEHEFEHAGFKCELRRGPVQAWCGYVLLPDDHPYSGRSMGDDNVIDLDVHGGVTFAGRIKDKGFALGFDCGHLYDMVWYAHTGLNNGVYRTFEYAKKETERLAEQLRKKVAKCRSGQNKTHSK